MKYTNLLKPLKVNNLILKNRMQAAPMDVVNANYMISSTFYGGISIYDKSVGGIGCIVIGADNDSPKDGIFAKYEREKTREILYIIKQAGAKSAAEVTGYGKLTPEGKFNGPVSGIRFDGQKMQEMSQSDMQGFCHRVARHAKTCKDFGFDMLFLCLSADSLCGQFLSPVWNTRKDDYGGSLENRAKFPIEIVKTVREYVGKDYPIQMQVSRNLLVPESYSDDDMLYFINQVKDYVDMINISSGIDTYGGTYNNYWGSIHTVTTNLFPHNYGIEFCKRVKQLTDKPVALVGGIINPDEAEQLIEKGYLDSVMLGRSLVADPFWPNKIKDGKQDDIIPCIRCCNCYHFTTAHKNVVCSVNPRFRRENRVPLKLEKAEASKRVVVVGGGPAGIKAALTAVQRGHEVILLEKSSRLGGLINCSDYSDYKLDLRRYRDYLLRQIAKSNVEVRLNTEANYDYVKALNPDAIIIALGAKQITPSIEGIDNKKVIFVTNLFEKQIKLDGKVVILGGGSVGGELALEICDQVKKVDIIEIKSELLMDANQLQKLSLQYFLKDKENVDIHTDTSLQKITDEKLFINNRYQGEKQLDYDYLVVCTGFKSQRNEVEQFYGICPDTYEVGDCEKVASVCEATNYAYFIAANL